MIRATNMGGGDRIVGAPFASRSPVLAQQGMAATSHPLSTQIAIDVLKGGGTAVDAAIAANAAIGLMEPTGSGLGGDLFAIVWDPHSSRLHGLNASGPSSATLSYKDLKSRIGSNPAIPAFGPLCVSVPGVVDGWSKLHAKFGRLPWDQLLGPAVEYAHKGFPVTQVIGFQLAENLDRFEKNLSLITEFDNFRRTYCPRGRMPREREIFKNPDLGRTLELLAEKGPDIFYRGRIAAIIDAYAKRVGAPIRFSDLENYQSEWVEPASVDYHGYQIVELPPNSQGIAALQMLNILEGFDLAAMPHNGSDYLHVHIEAKKLAYEDRARQYADPRFYEVPLATLLSKDYAQQRRGLIQMESAMQAVEGPSGLEKGDTIYLTVGDRNGMIVSLIQSNYLGMGSGLVPDDLGFVLQNRGALFSMDSQHANVYAPGKRAFNTIIPAFVLEEGQPFLSFGVMGGGMQPQGHVQILCNILDFGMNVQEAGDAARYHHEGSSEPTGSRMSNGGTVALESSISADVVASLAGRGHRFRPSPGIFGGYQAILWDRTEGLYHGASEMRKDGQAAGY